MDNPAMKENTGKRSKIIFDFDGVFTNPQFHARRVRAGVFNFLESNDIEKRTAREGFKKIISGFEISGKREGWRWGYGITSGYDEDPFSRDITVFQSLFKKYNIKDFSSIYLSIFHDITKDMQGYLKKDAAYLNAAAKKFRVYIITNSLPDNVRRMLGKYLPKSAVLIGNSKKYLLDIDFNKVPKYIKAGGINIPIRRPYYYRNLMKVRRSEENVVVVGDNFSVDLALPYHMGFDIVLKKNNYTPKWSLDFTRKNGRVIRSVHELIIGR